MNDNADRKITSAIYSSLSDFRAFLCRIARKESMQLAINKTHATPVTSSILVEALNFEIRTEVSTTKQKPNKLADVFKICGDLLSPPIQTN